MIGNKCLGHITLGRNMASLEAYNGAGKYIQWGEIYMWITCKHNDTLLSKQCACKHFLHGS